jgi:hypothetical protein
VHEAGAGLLALLFLERVVACDEPLAHLTVRIGDPTLVALEESGEQRRQQRLADRRVALEPAARLELRVDERRAVEPCEARQGEPRGLEVAAGDLVADDRGARVAEQQAERPGVGVVGRVEARRERAVELRRDLRVEAHLALVEPERDAGLTARLVLRRDLEHDRGRAGIALVLDRHAMAHAHLAGADALGLERRDGTAAQRVLQPFGREIGGGPDGQEEGGGFVIVMKPVLLVVTGVPFW